MCVTCGCSDDAQATLTHLATGETLVLEPATPRADESEVANPESEHTHVLPDGRVVTHHHSPAHVHPPFALGEPDGPHAHGQGRSHHSHGDLGVNAQPEPLTPSIAPLHSTSLAMNVLAKNNLIAAQNRGWFEGRGVLALNLVSSPGAGKTTLLARTISDLRDRLPFTVIEGDQATAHDAERIRATGCAVVQVNTGTGCHLEADMVRRGLQTLQPPAQSILMIENVGNLVCPALFDLGENAKVVILSVTEGEDKPLKYPHMFRASSLMLLNKIDLLPYVSFEVDRCLAYARQVNPDLQVFSLSATTGEGLDHWYGWLVEQMKALAAD